MIGICIKYFHENYGGMLQAYATITMMEKRRLDYELIRYEKHYSMLEKAKQLPRLFNLVLLNDKKEALLKKLGQRRHPAFMEKDAIRMSAFDKFRKEKFTRLSPVFMGYANLCKGAEKYSAVVTGSDQLWSPAGLPTNFYNLMFVPDNIRKISIYLADQQVNAVVRSKISKRKLAARSAQAGERQAFGMSAFFKILAYFGLFGWNCADT